MVRVRQQKDDGSACSKAWPSPNQLPGKQLRNGHKQDNSGETSGGVPTQIGQKPKSSTLRRQRRKRAARSASERTSSSEVCAPSVDSVQKSIKKNGCCDVSAKCAELVADLKAGGEAKQSAVVRLRGSMQTLAFDGEGCRVLQLALQVTDWRLIAELLPELHGRVLDAVCSPHANFVIQKIIELMPTAQAAFIVEEISGMAEEVACHRFGCRILCRLQEHCASATRSIPLLDEALSKADVLCKHAFGHYVIQSVLEHGTMRQREQVMEALCSDPLAFASNRNGCFVIEAAMSYCSAADQELFIERLIRRGSDKLATLAQGQFGYIVIRSMLRLPGSAALKLHNHLNDVSERLEGTKFGRRVMEDLGLGRGGNGDQELEA
mmetsp:Transcript_44046/g.84577  ORF Transcript_44046/g.84577 Transcript_44046/m.84577 type:complete len:379 (-) Transcript_44046:370-1506(-)